MAAERETWKLEFRVGEEVQRARVLPWTLKCVSYPAILREPGGQHLLWQPNRHHRQPFICPSANNKGNAPLEEGNWLHKLLRNAGICLASRIWETEVFGHDANRDRMEHYVGVS